MSVSIYQVSPKSGDAVPSRRFYPMFMNQAIVQVLPEFFQKSYLRDSGSKFFENRKDPMGVQSHRVEF